jgi:hypothetical protein
MTEKDLEEIKQKYGFTLRPSAFNGKPNIYCITRICKDRRKKMNNKELKKNLEKERKKQREDAIKINTFIRLDKSSASEIDKQIEQTYLSLQKNIKFVCTNKDLMNSMLDELDYIVYASKLYGGKHVMEELDNRYKNKLMS